MSEKITLFRPQDNIDPYDQAGPLYVSMSIGEDFVSLVHAAKQTGPSKTGKTWVRFQDQRVGIFKLREYTDGRPRVNYYEKNPRWDRVDHRNRLRGGTGKRRMQLTNMTSKLGTRYVHYDQYSVVAATAFLKLYEQRYGATYLMPTSWDMSRLAYPMLRGNTHWNYVRALGSALRQTDDRAFVEAMFGKTRYRKDLMKAVAGCNSTVALAIAKQFRGLVPTDWIINALNDVPAWAQYRELRDGVDTLRKVIKLVDQGSARRLLHGALDPQTPVTWIADCYKAIDKIALMEGQPQSLGKVTGWREVHDQLAAQARMVVKSNKPIPQKHKVVKALDGQVFEDKIELRHARDTDTLEMWGSQMNNCIGTYDQQARQEHTFLFGAYEGGELKGNLEVSKVGQVRQFVGKHNGKYPGDSDEIRKWIHGLTGYQEQIRVEHGGQAYLIDPNALANPYAPLVAELNAARPIAGGFFDELLREERAF